jgi:hypothetical protein
MDKSFSTRLNGSTVKRIEQLARRLRTSKKAVIEGAIDVYVQRIEGQNDPDVFDLTCGAWNRKESPARTVERSRRVLRQSLERRTK